MNKSLVITGDLARKAACNYVMQAELGCTVNIAERNRTVSQNSAQWPILEAFSKQLQWPVNGRMVNMTAEEWKDVLTAAFRKESPRLAMGLDGGVVMLGQRTSKFKVSEFSDWLEFLHAVAADRGVTVYEAVAA